MNQKKDKLKFYPFRSGSDGYNHLKEDIQLLKELGIDIYRLSISWARLYPNGDEEEPNIDGIRYYDEVFSEIKKKWNENIFNYDTLCASFIPSGALWWLD